MTPKKFKFTNANLKSLPTNPAHSSSTELEVSDTEIIGRFPDIDINQARKVVRKYKGLIADGIDPKAQRDNQTEYPSVYNHGKGVSRNSKSSSDKMNYRFMFCLLTTRYYQFF